MQTLDARGLSCPQPVLMLLDTIKGLERGNIEIIVDNDAAKENVIRAATSKRWRLRDIQAGGGEYRMTLTLE